VLGGLEVKLFDPISLDDRDPGFFPVARIDQHAHGHCEFSRRAVPAA